MIAEARQVLQALRVQATTPAGPSGVGRAIAARFQTYPQPERTQPEWRAFWQDYTDALEDLPEGAIEAAMKAWVRAGTSQFLPKPGELRQLAITTENRDVRAYSRALAATKYADALEDLPEGAIEAAMKAWVRAGTSQFLPKPQVPKKEARPFPASHGATDERGLTEAMRATIARRTGASHGPGMNE